MSTNLVETTTPGICISSEMQAKNLNNYPSSGTFPPSPNQATQQQCDVENADALKVNDENIDGEEQITAEEIKDLESLRDLDKIYHFLPPTTALLKPSGPNFGRTTTFSHAIQPSTSIGQQLVVGVNGRLRSTSVAAAPLSLYARRNSHFTPGYTNTSNINYKNYNNSSNNANNINGHPSLALSLSNTGLADAKRGSRESPSLISTASAHGRELLALKRRLSMVPHTMSGNSFNNSPYGLDGSPLPIFVDHLIPANAGNLIKPSSRVKNRKLLSKENSIEETPEKSSASNSAGQGDGYADETNKENIYPPLSANETSGAKIVVTDNIVVQPNNCSLPTIHIDTASVPSSTCTSPEPPLQTSICHGGAYSISSAGNGQANNSPLRYSTSTLNTKIDDNLLTPNASNNYHSSQTQDLTLNHPSLPTETNTTSLLASEIVYTQQATRKGSYSPLLCFRPYCGGDYAKVYHPGTASTPYFQPSYSPAGGATFNFQRTPSLEKLLSIT